MKNKILIPVMGLVSMFALLCGWSTDMPSSLIALAPTTDAKKLTIQTKVLTAEESKEHLNRDLLSRRVQPIQVTIHNNTSAIVTIEDIDAKQISVSRMTNRIAKDAVPRLVGFRTAALVFWPIGFVATIDGLKTFTKYMRMKREFAARKMKLEAIPPYSDLNRVLFIACEDMKDTVSVTLYNQENGKLEEYKLPIG